MTQLIIFRGIQGVGGGMIQPVAHTIVGDLFTGKQRARMQGLFTGVFGLASATGPLIGGWIVDMFHWKYIFLMNLPTGALALLLSAWTMQNGAGSAGRRIDWRGSLLSIVGVTGLLLALQGGGEHWAWDSWQSVGLFATSAIAIGLFVRNELRAPDPILDLKLFANRTFMVAALLGFILGAGMFGAIVFFPWFIQGVIGASATSAGTVLMPMTLMMVAASVVGGQIAQRLEYRWQAGGGLLLVGTGFLLATRFTPATTLWGARAAIMVLGFGVGLVQPILTIAVQQAFSREKRGTVTAAITFFRAIGSTVGVTLFGILFNWQMSRQFDLRLAPMLNGLPTALVDKPSNLVQILLQPQLRARFPEAVATVKTMMAGAIHPVFWISVVVMLCGILSAQLFGRESLTAQTQRQAAEASRAVR